MKAEYEAWEAEEERKEEEAAAIEEKEAAAANAAAEVKSAKAPPKSPSCEVKAAGSCMCQLERDMGARLSSRETFFQCFTCNFIDDQGVCANCADRCHVGHDLSAPFSWGSGAYCDCPTGGDDSDCGCLTLSRHQTTAAPSSCIIITLVSVLCRQTANS
jgi:hypothetical protein